MVEHYQFSYRNTKFLAIAAEVTIHDMHLSGVEQSHREELGVFLRGLDKASPVAPRDGERPTIEPPKAMAGAEQAIGAMRAWWADLLAELRARSAQAAAA